jgi:hypothetical protein
MLDQPSPRLRLGGPFHATRNPGVGQDFTGLAAAVQLRLRVAVLADGHQGLQALQRCSGLLNRRARGSTVATHQPSLAASRRAKTVAPKRTASRRTRPRMDSELRLGRPFRRCGSAATAGASARAPFVNCRAHCPTRVRASPSAPFRGRNGTLKNSGEACRASSLGGTSAFCGPPSAFCSRSSITRARRFERRR